MTQQRLQYPRSSLESKHAISDAVLDEDMAAIDNANGNFDINNTDLLNSLWKHLSHPELYARPFARQRVVELLEAATHEITKTRTAGLWEVTTRIPPGQHVHHVCPPQMKGAVELYVKMVDAVVGNLAAFEEEDLKARLARVNESKPFEASIPARGVCIPCRDRKRKCNWLVPCDMCTKHGRTESCRPQGKLLKGSFLDRGGVHYVIPVDRGSTIIRCANCDTDKVPLRMKDKEGRMVCDPCSLSLGKLDKNGLVLARARISEERLGRTLGSSTCHTTKPLASKPQNTHFHETPESRSTSSKRIRRPSPTPDSSVYSSTSKRARTDSGAEIAVETSDRHGFYNSGGDNWSVASSVSSNEMTAADMFECLLKHGCMDLRSCVLPDRFSSCRVAEGGFGDVWKGQLAGGVDIAVKVLRYGLLQENGPKSIKRAMREIYNWSKLEHKNVHKLLGVTMFEGRLGMVSKWMEQGTLRQYLERSNGIDRYALCLQVTAGVAYLHDMNMVHGDLKACNILISSDGTPKLTDFDYSILSNCTSLAFSATTRIGGGTARWMAPELITGEKNLQRNKQTDVYALGMTLLETITNELPYSDCRSDVHVCNKISRKEHPKRSIECFPDNEQGNLTWDLLLKCWDFAPDSRPTAGQILVLLELCINAGHRSTRRSSTRLKRHTIKN